MAVKLRLSRGGARKRPFYRIVAADTRCPRDGRFLEKLGTYNPLLEKGGLTLKQDRVDYWLGVGAQPLPNQGAKRANQFGDYLAKRNMERRLAEAKKSKAFQLLRALVPAGLRARGRRALIHPRASKRLLKDQLEQGEAAVSPLSAETRARLLELFEPTTREIEAELGRELSSWRR